MKKLALALLFITLSVINLYVLQFNNEDYSNAEIDALIDEMQPSQTDRFMSVILEDLLVYNNTFTEVGDTVTGFLDGYDYGYIVIESDIAQTVEIEINVIGFETDINVYFNSVNNASFMFDYDTVYSGMSIEVTIPIGFTVIELDSYNSVGQHYSITIKEK